MLTHWDKRILYLAADVWITVSISLSVSSDLMEWKRCGQNILLDFFVVLFKRRRWTKSIKSSLHLFPNICMNVFGFNLSYIIIFSVFVWYKWSAPKGAVILKPFIFNFLLHLIWSLVSPAERHREGCTLINYQDAMNNKYINTSSDSFSEDWPLISELCVLSIQAHSKS